MRGKRAECHRRVRRAKGRSANCSRASPEVVRETGKRIQIAEFALIGRHSGRSVALEMLDRGEALARGKVDVSQRDVVLEIDECIGSGDRLRRGIPGNVPGAGSDRMDVGIGFDRDETMALFVKGELAPEMRMEVHRGLPATCHQHRVAGDFPTFAVGHGGDMLSPMRRPDRADRHDLRPRLAQALGTGIASNHDDALADQHALVFQIGKSGTGQHDARKIVARKDAGLLMGSSRKNDSLRTDLPQALPWSPTHGGWQVIGHALRRDHQIAVVEAQGRGSIEMANSRKWAERRSLVDQHDPAFARGGLCSCAPRNAAADDQDFAMRMDLVVVIGVGRGRGRAKARQAADYRLVEPGPGLCTAKEGLVVKARREQPADKPGRGPEVEAHRRPRILAPCNQSVVKFNGRCPRVGLDQRVLSDCHKRVGFLGSSRKDAARTVVFEAAPDKMHTVRQKRRGKRIAGMAGHSTPVEGEGKYPAAIDP